MKRSRKSKGVSWAPGVNLCQVKLFSSEDCPSIVGLKSPDHLQAKTPWMLHPYTTELNDCPPGFEVTEMGNQLADLSCISLIKWKCPPKFAMSCNWCVAAGEESKEVESQKLREMRFLEAVYPRASAIPPGATVSIDIEDEFYDDSLTPLVPVIPIEEDECGDMESDSATVGNFSTGSMQTMTSNIQLESAIPKTSIEISAGEKATERLPDAGVDVAAAASTALAVLMKSTEQGSMIDTNLLIKIFSDPNMIQNLTTILPLPEADSGIPPPIATAAPIPVSKPVSQSVSFSVPKSDKIQKLLNVSYGMPSTVTSLPQMSTIPSSDVKPASVPSHVPAPDPNKVKTTIPNPRNYPKIGAIPTMANVAPVSNVRKEAHQLKDLNYYKNLVRQHGDQKENTKEHKLGQDGNNHNHHKLNMVLEIKADTLKPKNQKQCIYFNSPKGCRNGINCQFKHDISLTTQNAKRMKLYSEVRGR